MSIVLASKSPRRRMLLEQLGLKFGVAPSSVDEEKIKEKNPEKLAMALAELKALDIAGKIGGENIVIGADTLVYFDGNIIGQPKDAEDARKMLGMLSGETHDVYTGFCLVNQKTGEKVCGSSHTYVTLRELSEKDIDECLKVNKGVALTGAGSYTPELYSRIFEKIEGSLNNVIGLPTEKLIPLLRSFGVDV